MRYFKYHENYIMMIIFIIFHSSSRSIVDNDQSPSFLNVLNSLRKPHIVGLREEQRNEACNDGYGAKQDLWQREPHLVQEAHKRC